MNDDVGVKRTTSEASDAPSRLYDDYVVTWSQPLMNGTAPTARGGHSAVVVTRPHHNHLIIFGGHYFGGSTSGGGSGSGSGSGEGSRFVYLNDVHVLDLLTSTWFTPRCVGRPPRPRYHHTATCMKGGKGGGGGGDQDEEESQRMFIFGGRGEGGVVYSDMFFLNTSTWCWYSVTWTTKAPSPRFGHANVAVGNQLVIWGGWNAKQGKQQQHQQHQQQQQQQVKEVEEEEDLWVFDTETFAWRSFPTTEKAPTPRHGHSMVLTERGEIIVFAGHTPPSSFTFTSSSTSTSLGVSCLNQATPAYHADVRVLDTETMLWSRPRVFGDLPLPRFAHGCAGVGDMMFIIGGWSGTTKGTICLGDKRLKEKARDQTRAENVRSGPVHENAPSSSLDKLDRSMYLHILNTTSMQWEIPPSRGTMITNRYGHTCSLVGPHLFLFGGWDGNRALNELFVGELPVEGEEELKEQKQKLEERR